MHLLVKDVPERNFVKNFSDNSYNKSYNTDSTAISPCFLPLDERAEKISNFFDSEIQNYENLYLRKSNSTYNTANNPITPIIKLNENPCFLPKEGGNDNKFRLKNDSEKLNFLNDPQQMAKIAEYACLSSNYNNAYFNVGNDSENKIYGNYLAHRQDILNNPNINYKINENANVNNQKKNEIFNNFHHIKFENETYNNNYFNHFHNLNRNNHFYETTKEQEKINCFNKNDDLLNNNLINSNAMSNYDFNRNINNNINLDAYDYNHNYINLKINPRQESFNYLSYPRITCEVINNNYMGNNNNINNAHYENYNNEYKDLKDLINIYNSNIKVNNSKSHNKNNKSSNNIYFEKNSNIITNNNTGIPLYSSLGNTNTNKYNYLFDYSNKSNMTNYNISNFSLAKEKSEFLPCSQKNQAEKISSKNLQISTAPISKKSEDVKLLSKKRKKQNMDRSSVEIRKMRMQKIKNETMIFNNLISKSNSSETPHKDPNAPEIANGSQPISLNDLQILKSIKNNKSVYVLRNNLFQNPGLNPIGGSVRNPHLNINENNIENNKKNKNELESNAINLNVHINSIHINKKEGDEVGFLNVQSNKESSTVDIIENNQQKRKEESSTEFNRSN